MAFCERTPSRPVPSPALAVDGGRRAPSSQRFKARQAKEPAGSLDGVDEAEDVAEDRSVVGVLFEPDEPDVDHIEALVGLGQEFAQQVIHCRPARPVGTRQATSRPVSCSEVSGKRVKSC